jgi:hypothetical protein
MDRQLYIIDDKENKYTIDTSVKETFNITSNSILDKELPIISKRLFAIFNRSEYILYPITSTKLVKLDKSKNIYENLIEISKEFVKEEYSETSKLFKILVELIEIEMTDNHSYRKHLIDQYNLSTYNLQKEEIRERNVSDLIKNVFEKELYRIKNTINDIEGNITAVEIKNLNIVNPSRFNYTYEDLKDIVMYYHSNNTRYFYYGSNDLDLIYLEMILRYPENVVNDEAMLKIIQDNMPRFSPLFNGTISKLTNKNLELIVSNIIRNNSIKYNTILIFELYRRNMNKLINLINLSFDQKINILESVAKEYSDVYEYYKKEIATIKNEILSVVNEDSIMQVLEAIKKFIHTSRLEYIDVLNFVFNDDQSYEKLSFLREKSSNYKKLLINTYIKNRSERPRDVEFLQSSDNKLLVYSDLNSVYTILNLFIDQMKEYSETFDVKLYTEIVIALFKSIASASSSEKTISLRMLSFFIHADYNDIKYADDQKDQLNQKILIFMEELGKSTIRNSTIEKMLKKFQIDSGSMYWFAKRIMKKNLMFGLEYIAVSDIIKDSENIRDIIKTTLLLLVLN